MKPTDVKNLREVYDSQNQKRRISDGKPCLIIPWDDEQKKGGDWSYLYCINDHDYIVPAVVIDVRDLESIQLQKRQTAVAAKRWKG